MLLGNAQNAKKNDLVFSNKVSQKKGLANFLQIDCSDSDCNFVYTTYSSKHVNRESTPGQNPFDINDRAIIGFREIGKGHSAMERLFSHGKAIQPWKGYLAMERLFSHGKVI